MIEYFKERLADKIHQKEIGLVMLVDRGGRIRWHAGRAVTGRTIQEGLGFSRTHLLEVIGGGGEAAYEDVMISATELGFPQSARFLYVRSLFIHPVDRDLVLYVDSGNDAFDPDDLQFFRECGIALRDLLAELRSQQESDGGIAGASAAVRRIRELALAFAVEEDAVLLLGETGVGKSHIAQLIHRFSGRAGQLIVVDTPAIPEQLFESELFGHARGSFTGAVRDKKGLLEAAEEGTLFLDEIAEVPLAFQAKLLRFMDSHRFRPVGETRERTVSVRVIAATNRDLHEEISRGRFREDLFFRLNVLTIEIPPLRARPDDLRALVADHSRHLRGKLLDPSAWRILEHHGWPGNVRELINVLKRAGIQLPGPAIGAEISQLLSGRGSCQPAGGSASLDRVRSELAAGRSFWDSAWEAFLDRDINREELRSLLTERFSTCRHSLKELARALRVADEEYSRFVSALHKYRVHPGQPPL